MTSIVLCCAAIGLLTVVASAAAAQLSARRARARRFPSCMAATRATGIVRPCSMSPVGRRCGAGILSAHGSRPASAPIAVCTVKSAGVTWSRSDQSKGNDTGVPGRRRGLYAATTVAPPARVESTNTFPARSSTMKAVVASAGSSASALAASARVAAPTSSTGAWSSIGTKTWRPFAPLVLTAPA